MKREYPQQSLHAVASLFNRFNGNTIVEIGGLAMLPSDPKWDRYGGSTLVWAQRTSAETIHTVDVNSKVVDQTCELAKDYPQVQVSHMDGIKFLESFDGSIDLLYLDAWDAVHGTPYKEHHRNAFIAAMPNLHEKSFVLIDDTDIDGLGKGEFVIPLAIGHGFHMWWQGRQTLLSKVKPIVELAALRNS